MCLYIHLPQCTTPLKILYADQSFIERVLLSYLKLAIRRQRCSVHLAPQASGYAPVYLEYCVLQ
jgi:hypothetical protein